MTQHDTATSRTFLKVTLQILYMLKYIKLKKKKIEKEKAGSTMLRIRTLDLETSPSALPAAQGTNKCGSISFVRIQTSFYTTSLQNGLPTR